MVNLKKRMDGNGSSIRISGIPLATVTQNVQMEAGSLVSVPSLESNLRSVALAVAAQTAVLLQGPVGCGKTMLVEHLARLTGRQDFPHLIKVQLSDQTDSKLLLGTYCCTEVPGQFVWKPGTLTQAVKLGSWILLEDIDYAPMDVVSLLVPLLESRSLFLPSQGTTVSAHPSFQLFATQRMVTSGSGISKQHIGQTGLLDRLWTKVIVEPLSHAELEKVIVTQWPNLQPIVGRMLESYFLLSSGRHAILNDDSKNIAEEEENISHFSSYDGRMISTRDLLKWCQRLAQYFELCSPAASAFQDAFDCFCQNISKPANRIPVAVAIATRFNLLKTKAEFYCCKYKPNIDITSEALIIGRAKLQRKESESAVILQPKVPFSFTRPAVALMEQVAVAIQNQEPVLLVGETGTGKTSTVQYLAEHTGCKLMVVNMNQQSDGMDLLGGYKPIELKHIVSPLRDEFEELFCKSFSRVRNAQFLGHVATCYLQQRWKDFFPLLLHPTENALKKFRSGKDKDKILWDKWKTMSEKIHKVQLQLKDADSTLAFSFIEGSLVKAVRSGFWLLLDEINLAAPETLECLSGLLESTGSSVMLLDKGDLEPVPRHKDFRLFACMNPATDVGKKDLPAGIRNRFTEFFVDELEEENDLQTLVHDYLQGLSISAAQVDGIVRLYLSVRKRANQGLVDGTGRKPHYSLRTLCRALSCAASNPCGSVPRSLYESFCLAFLTQLDRASHPAVEQMIRNQILPKNTAPAILQQPIPSPSKGRFVQIQGYWIPQGRKEPRPTDKYILTPSVQLNLKNLARIIALGHHPVLLQGETSVGKTSMIQYVAVLSGNKCVRINNHEHTDLQEYVGSYAANQTGKLVFKPGVLVNAMREGSWIILDELNLAPTEVLEALNRVLDDNRELFIAETQEVIKAHPQFMLFATQNPPGLYGGRKILSRAFRNRFIEVHFNELPAQELETILHQRCEVPESYCHKLVAVMLELQMHRRGSNVFSGKQGFITLRDLFRWGERYRLAEEPPTKLYDWDQHLAEEGYLLLAGRSRRAEEDRVIQQVLEKLLKRKVAPERLFTLNQDTSHVTRHCLQQFVGSNISGFEHIVWTYDLRRLAVLVFKALQFSEPVLLVGETGCGKTSVCQIFANLAQKKLLMVNCHMHSESADFLGGLRPIHNRDTQVDDQRLFEWVDGPLVIAMNQGCMFLADEISLADDSVLERLNSVLEPEKTLLLAEKGDSKSDGEMQVVAAKDFHFLATMNPGGDYGKKELSPALRNRFTEVWCLASSKHSDLCSIIEHNLKPQCKVGSNSDDRHKLAVAMLDFLDFLKQDSLGKKCTVSIRDILSWVDFINRCTKACDSTKEAPPLQVGAAYVHGAYLVFLDSLGAGVTGSLGMPQITKSRNSCLEFLVNQVKVVMSNKDELENLSLCGIGGAGVKLQITSDDFRFGIHPFYIDKVVNTSGTSFELSAAPTTCSNAQRVLRAMQLDKPILLEGSPGVGKTSLVFALASAAGHHLIRINLSEQTDVSDLFGADFPVAGGSKGQFAWRDGPLLSALKNGYWVVFDEMNLASQSVLEGMNACLDHRGEVYVPELGRTFHVQPQKTRIFACQNPLQQGGARKGLPRSFLNRFTQVYVEPLSDEDLQCIMADKFSTLPKDMVQKMVEFASVLCQQVVQDRQWGQKGAPWEFNLRDLFRWAEIMMANQISGQWDPGEYVGLIFSDCMRTLKDKQKALSLYSMVFGENSMTWSSPRLLVMDRCVGVGRIFLPRHERKLSPVDDLCVLPHQLHSLESLMACIQRKWMAILVGPKSSGKTSLVKLLASLTGNELQVLTMNSAMDTGDLLGGFEQLDPRRKVDDLVALVECLLRRKRWSKSGEEKKMECLAAVERMHGFAKQVGVNVSPDILAKMQEVLKEVKTHEACLDSEEQDHIIRLETYLNELDRDVHLGIGGGHFEWVDSVLVKALERGHWVLLDNVNFCSPSVLDRLNALLEPGGVLAIHEQGISEDQVRSVVPHPDFRLVLAMDPKNGEISGAMRNRGVEIYLLGEEGDKESLLSRQDVYQLLGSLGMKNVALQDLLLDIHSAMQNVLPAWEKPGLLELHRSAFFTVKQLNFGVETLTAVRHSAVDTYIQSQKSNTKKMELISALEAILCRTCTSVMVSAPSHTLPPSVGEFGQHPISATARTQGIIIKALEENNTIYIPSTPDIERFLIPAVRIFLGMASPADLCLRWPLIPSCLSRQMSAICSSSVMIKLVKKHLREPLENAPALTCVKELMKNLTAGSDMLTGGIHCPFDLRWHPQLLVALACRNSSVQDQQAALSSFANKLHLMIAFHLQQTLEVVTETHMKSQPKATQKQIPWHLSRTVAEGQESFRDLPHPAIVPLFPLLKALDALIRNILDSQHLLLDNQQMCAISDALEWRHRFWLLITKRVIFAEPQMGQFLSCLALHWMWLREKALPVLLQNVDLQHKLRNRLDTLINSMETHVSINVHQRQIKAETWRKHIGNVQPFKSQEQANMHQELERLSSCISVWSDSPSEDCFVENCKVLNLCNGGQEIRSMLAKAIVENAAGNEVDTTLKAVKEHLHSQFLLGERTNVDPSSTSSIRKQTKCIASRVQLWPLLDHLNICLELRTMVELLSGTLQANNNSELVTDWQEQILHCTPSPASHIAAFMIMKRKLELSQGSTKYWGGDAQLMLNFYNRLQHSPATRDSWLHWQPLEDQGWDSAKVQKDVTSAKNSTSFLHSPFQSYCAAHLLVDCCWRPAKMGSDSPDSTVTCNVPLNFCQEKAAQMEVVNWIWWRNCAAFGSKYYSFKKNECQLLASLFRTTLLAILQSDSKLSLPDFDNDMSQVEEQLCIKKTMDDVQRVLASIMSDSDLLDSDTLNLIKRSSDALQTLVSQVFKTQEVGDCVWSCGHAWLSLGLLSVHLLSIFAPFDPAERQATLAKYCQQEVTELEMELSVHKWMQVAMTGENLETMSPKMRHPHINDKLNKVEVLKTSCADLKNDLAYRPHPSQFNALMMDVQQLVGSVASQMTANNLVKEAEAALNDSSLVTPCMNRVEAWKRSVNAALTTTKRRYPLYQDLWMPLLAGIAQVNIGIDLLTTAVKRETALKKQNIKEIDLHNLILTLASFPSMETGLQLAQKLLAPNTISIVQSLMTERTNLSFSSIGQSIDNLLLSGLEEIRNSVVSEGRINPKTWTVLLAALKVFLLRWERQEEEKRQRKAEKEAAYEFRLKTYCKDLTPEEVDANYVHKMFPTYDEDFQDFAAIDSSGDFVSPMEEKNVEFNENEGEAVTFLTMEAVCSLHCQLMTHYTCAPWLTVEAATVCPNYRRPFVARYQVAGQILKEQAHLLDADLDHKLLSGHAVFSTLLQQAISANTQESGVNSRVGYDVYHDANVSEVIQCRPVLENLLSRILTLLLEWPDHPSLKQVQDVIDRVLRFPVTDPLMKFVTGLELVLAKAQEWEINAHKGVSLMTEMEGVSLMIIKWRKLELSCWSSCLDNVFSKMESECSKWWFHLFAVVVAFLKEDETGMSANTVTNTIQQFLETSSVVEFKPRLRIVLAFHCHLVHVKPSKKQEKLLKILWNAFLYYSQFLPAVVRKTSELRKPIEKEVKEFVKIVRWNDVNFWTIKETVEKSHRTIAKHMKNFEKVLSQPVRPFLTDSHHDLAQPPESAASLQTNVYIIPSRFKQFIMENPLPASSSDILTKLSRLFHRLRKLSRHVVENSFGHQQSELIDELTVGVITTAHDLQALEVNKNEPKPKQIAAAKSIHIRKRKALSDLFKTLHNIGLSYRKGMLMWNEKIWTQFMDLPMMDIDAALKQLKQQPADGYLVQSWQGCLHYLHRSVARMALLSTSSQMPHKDLGLPNLHRICGIPSHIMALAQTHHQALSQVEHDFVKLRLLVEDIDSAVIQSDGRWPLPEASTHEHVQTAKTLYLESQQLFEHFSILLSCCPKHNADAWVAPASLRHEASSGHVMIQGDQTWDVAIGLVQAAQATNSRCKQLLMDLCPRLNRIVNVYSQKTVQDLRKVFEELTSISTVALQLANLFTSSGSSSAFVHSLHLFSDNTTNAAQQFRRWEVSFEIDNGQEEESVLKSMKICRTLTAKLAQKILIVIQDLYKSQSPIPSAGQDDLLPNALPYLCQKFKTIAAQLKLKTICRLTAKATRQLQHVYSLNSSAYHRHQCFRWFKSVYPFLGQYLALVQFSLTDGATLQRTMCKLMSVLLGIFNELVQKGFCVPDEYSEDVSGEGATDFQDIEGGGLGEGEGLKDVSDRIEDEDQLEGAQQEGAEKEEEEDPSQKPDLKEEEHGIEMSEDFDGKSHDLDKEDGSDSNSDEEEDEDENQLDKQMGEVDEGEEKLDEKVWGSDSDDDDDEEGEDDKMEDGKGDGQSSEPQMVAKDDNKSKEDGESKPHSDTDDDVNGQEPPINEMDEREFDKNEVDPYQENKAPEDDSVEPMEMSDDLNLDSGEEKDEDKTEGDEEMEVAEEEVDAVDEDKIEETKEGNEEGKEVPEAEEESKSEENSTMKIEEEDMAEQGKVDDEDDVQRDLPSTKPYNSQEPVQTTEADTVSGAPSNVTQAQLQSESDGQDGQQSEQDCTPGMSQAEQTEQGQKGKSSLQASMPDSSTDEKQAAQQQHPGQTNPKRTLGDMQEVGNKRLRTMDQTEDDNAAPNPQIDKNETRHADLYEHVEEQNSNDMLTKDAATVDQAKEQQVYENEAPDNTETTDAQDDVAMNEERSEDEEINTEGSKSAKITSTNQNAAEAHEEKIPSSLQEPMLVEGENVATMTAGQNQESTFHTNLGTSMELEGEGIQDVEAIRVQLEHHLGQWNERHNSSASGSQDALNVWHQFELVTLPLAQELCEQLRLVLEPSLAAKLRGDYRTGKRLNMRKVIQYIASQFRKDKIWLRRTKPSKRQYQVMLAMDDSSSMADNKVKELAFESLAVVSKAMVLLEVGEIAVASFGESFHLLHPFHEPFTDVTGAQILQQFTFEQKQTRVSQLLNEAVHVMKGSEKRLRGNMDAAQLLLIISDGRGLFVEGQQVVQQAVRKAQDNHIFVVFIVLDLPTNKHSIFDIRLPVYDKDRIGLTSVKSYMDEFPFPFYMVLRDIVSLPAVLSDALRQWFELVSAAV